MLLRNGGASDDSVCALRDDKKTSRRKAQASPGLRTTRSMRRIGGLGKGDSNALHYRTALAGTTRSESGEFAFVALVGVCAGLFLGGPHRPGKQRGSSGSLCLLKNGTGRFG